MTLGECTEGNLVLMGAYSQKRRCLVLDTNYEHNCVSVFDFGFNQIEVEPRDTEVTFLLSTVFATEGK